MMDIDDVRVSVGSGRSQGCVTFFFQTLDSTLLQPLLF